MSIITMCQDKSCPKKENCYRYKAKPDKYLQSYFVKTPRKNNGDCEFFWEIKNENN